MKTKWCAALFLLCASTAVYAQNIGISGSLAWNTMEIQTLVSLELASANLKLPSGRSQGEDLINSKYLGLMRPVILGIQADSSATLGDLVQRGEWTLAGVNDLALKACGASPFLSPDMRNLQASYTIKLEEISNVLIRHRSPIEIRRVLSPLPAPAYTGLIIIATEPLPIHGMNSSAQLVPCLFPKIWDTGMNLLFERNMLEQGKKTMAVYSSRKNIFHNSPSGLSPELESLAGPRPLRIIARGLFGDTPTDLIIDSADALSILSTEENRRLLHQGKVVIIIDDAALMEKVSY